MFFFGENFEMVHRTILIMLPNSKGLNCGILIMIILKFIPKG
jgi:hypothetical protein